MLLAHWGSVQCCSICARLCGVHVPDILHGSPQVMVNNLSKLTGTAVAVVGMAHLDGIERLWEARQAQHTAGAAAAKAWQPKELSHPLGGELSGL